MANPDFSELRRVRIDPELLSRGSGERIALQDAVVYDFMPLILGNRFRVDDTLRRATHFFKRSGSFMMRKQAYKEVTEQELTAGNLVFALEAYKRALHNAVGFVGAMAMSGDRALLSPTEIERFELQGSFGALERGLISAIVAAGEDTKIDLPQYAEWLGGVRRLERDAFKLNQQYFGCGRKYPGNNFSPEDPRKWEWETSLKGDMETGTKLGDTYAQMQRYQDAAWISKELGDAEKEAKYRELAKTDPVENPRYQPILERIQDAYDRSRGYI